MPRVNPPIADGSVEADETKEVCSLTPPAKPAFNRVAFSGAHVAADAAAPSTPGSARRSTGTRRSGIASTCSPWLGVAEAMDTAQRGMGLDWPTALELIKRTVEMAKGRPGALVASGADAPTGAAAGLATADVIAAYEEQAAAVEGVGGRIILMASRALRRRRGRPRTMSTPTASCPVPGPRARHPPLARPHVRPVLAGYWGSEDLDEAMDVCLRIIHAHPAKVDGIKISLLDKEKEIAMRRRLPEGVKMYTGDDFHYPGLSEGTTGGTRTPCWVSSTRSPRRPRPRSSVGAGDAAEYRRILAPTVPLLAARLRGADAVLQVGRGLPGLAERLKATSSWSAASSAAAPCTTPVVPPGRRSRPARRPTVRPRGCGRS